MWVGQQGRRGRTDWRSACGRAGARTIIRTLYPEGLRDEHRALSWRVLLHVVCLLLSVCFCVAVGCAVFVFVDSVMVCIWHAVIFPPPLCYVFWSEFGYHRYVCNSMLSGSVLFCVVLFCVLCNVLFCKCVVLARSAMSSYGMLRASPIWSFLFSVLV